MALGLGVNHSVTDYALGWEPTDSEPIGTAILFLKNNTNVSVSAWLDEISNTGDFTQSTSTRQATVAEGGLDFDGVDNYYARNNLLSIAADIPSAIVFVFSPSGSLGSPEGIFGSTEESNASSIAIANVDNSPDEDSSIVRFTANGQATAFTWPNIITTTIQYIIILKTGGGALTAYHNQHGNAEVDNSPNENVFNIRDIGFGNSSYFQGILHEAFIISDIPSAGYETELIKDYLNYKFNLTAA
tara:strand:- start:226 stop:957 length:732 start_codon:yes stop_codon:yes gene_type:complete